MTGILWATFAAVIVRIVAQTWLVVLNLRQVRRNRDGVPEALQGVMDASTYAKAGDYTTAKLRLGVIESAWDSLILLVVLFSGMLPVAWDAWNTALGSGAWSSAGFMVACLLVLSIPGLPWEWWAQFRLEERFGFNRTSPGLWVVDRIKGSLLAVVIGVPILWLIITIVESSGPLWWLWAWLALTGVKLVLAVALPWLIMPLFNKFSPLDDAVLRERLMALADRGGFRARSIHVMDGSKRSAHSNAFFTGFGRFRRIVLFDTLIAQLEVDGLEAVLAHEIGHFRRGHIWKGLAVGAALTLVGFLIIGQMMASPAFFAAFGFSEPVTAIAFLLFGLLAGVVGFWFSPLENLISRRHEYEADAFARALVGSAEPLVRALSGLARENLSNLTPHPVYSAFYYSHPTLVERVAALRRSAAATGVAGR